MISYTELKQRGRDWLDDFSQIEFVGEIEVTEEEVGELCASLGTYLDRAKWDEHLRTALAVAVVNLAYYSPQDVGEAGFRWLALHKLLGRHLEDDGLWKNGVGEPILRLLKEHFQAEDTGVAYRFVTPIMRQAGVPVQLDRRFAQFVVRLLRLYGHSFSDTEYKACCVEFEGQLSTAEKFLNSSKGRQYCRDIARIVRNVEEGILTPQQVDSLSFRLRTKVRAVLHSLSDSPQTAVRVASFPSPRLVLDRDNLRLVIEFSPEGLSRAYQWSDGTRIRAARYILKEGDFIGALRGKVIQPHGQTEEWRIEPWRPSPTTWGAFRESDGSRLETSDGLRPGRHILALPYPHAVPEEHVIEECGELYLPGCEDVLVRVFDCELPRGFSLDALKLSVSGVVPADAPVLRFGETPKPLPHTAGVYIRELPEIIIEGWTPEFANSYMLVWDSGARRGVVPESLYNGKAVFRLPVEAPSQGRIHIEPKGRTPRGFTETALNYVLLPDAKIDWPSGLHEKSARVPISIEPADKFAVEWQQSSVERVGASTWEVPPRLDFVNGQVTYTGTVSFHIAGPVHRFDIRGEAVTDGVLWDDGLRWRSRLYLSLSAAECGRSVELGIIAPKGFAKVIDLGPVPRGRLLAVSTDDVRDAFDHCGLPAGCIALRLGQRVVRSDIAFLHERLILESLFEGDDGEFAGWCGQMPDDLQHAVRSVRGMRVGLVPPFAVPPATPPGLRQSLSFYAVCGRVIDGTEKDGGVEEISDLPLKEALTWYAAAREYIDAGASFNPREAVRLLEHRPKKDSPAFRKASRKAARTPADRWRASLAQVLRTLRKLKSPEDYKRMVSKWSGHCRNENWRSAASSLLARAPGGDLLTRAAEDYRFGLEEFSRGETEKANGYLSSACVNVRNVMAQVREGMVLEVASALETMIFYHFGHEQFEMKARETISSLGEHWDRFKKTLGVLCGDVSNGEAVPDSLGLSDFSPHDRDIEMEERTAQ